MTKKLVVLTIFLIYFINFNLLAHSQDKETEELEKLRQEALTQSALAEAIATDENQSESLVSFISGQRSLQAINPEISIVGDGFAKFHLQRDDWDYRSPVDRNGAFLRVLGFHFQANLDPYSWTKICVGVTPTGVALGEAYMTWNSILPRLSLTIGKFRQQFGIVNRWHVPGLDQFDFPLAMTTILGGSGLTQTGFSFEWLMPELWAHANVLTLQVTNGENPHLFAGNYFTIPSVLAHLKNYYDLNESTYLELGLTGMVGFNNHKGKSTDETLQPTTTHQHLVAEDSEHHDEGNDHNTNLAGSKTAEHHEIIDQDRRKTLLGGIDLTLNWEPLKQAKYHSLTFRNELYYAYKEQEPTAVNHHGDPVKAYGFYSYLHYRINENWEMGVRYDFTQPFALNNSEKYLWQVMPYLNWWQSHWVRLRLHYMHKDGHKIGQRPDDLVLLQITWAVGPHKHERY